MRVCIKVWRNTFDYINKKYYDDEGLLALDALRYGPVYEVESIYPSLEDELLGEFKDVNPDFKYDDHKLHMVE